MLLNIIEFLRACRHCGHATSADLVADATIGEAPLVVCANLVDCRDRQEQGTALKPVLVADITALPQPNAHRLAHIHNADGECVKSTFSAPAACPVSFADGTVVRFKEEDEIGGEPVGPCGIVSPGQSTVRVYDPTAEREWFRLDVARDLANRLGLPLLES